MSLLLRPLGSSQLRQGIARGGLRLGLGVSSVRIVRVPSRFSKALQTMAVLGQLDPVGVYGDKKKAEEIVQKTREEITQDIAANMVGPLLRMAFHDAGTFEKATGTGGVNGSIRFEVHDPFSAGMEEGFKQLEVVHEKLQAKGFPITWADLFQVAGAVMVERAGGPHIPVEIGRRDTDQEDEDFQNKIPDEDFGPKELVANMESHGFNKRDIVAISGAHTVGSSKHHPPEGAMKVSHAYQLKHSLDDVEKNTFNNKYYTFLLQNKEGRFPSDTALLQDPEMLKWVEAYAQDQALFFKDFTASYLKMGLLGVNGGA